MSSKSDRRKKIWFEFTISSIFIIFIFYIAIINCFKSDSEISMLENRNLKQKPVFSLTDLFNGNFTNEYEDYISDQFVNRDFWIKLKAKSDMICGKKEINNVYIGNDNYLFEDFTESSDEETKQKIEAVNTFIDKNNSLNISFMLVPTSGKIYEENFPQYAVQDDQNKYIDKIRQGLTGEINFINVYNDLEENKDKYIYYKTDHHWTTDGAYIAYNSMCRQLNMEAVDQDEFDVKTVSDDFHGSLYYKLGAGIGVNDTIKVYIPQNKSDILVNYVDEQEKSASLYKDSKLDTKDKYEVFMNGNHKHVKINTLVNRNRKLLIFKDSYANSFIPFLTNHYGQIDVIDLRYYTDNINDLIQSEGITDVLFLYNVNTFNDDNSILNIGDF